MKITYITNSKIDSLAANAVNISSMCSSFAGLGNDVTLLVPNNLDSSFVEDQYFKKFNCEHKFKIKTFQIFNLPFLRSIQFIIRGFIEVKKLKPDLLFVRSHIDYLLLSLYNKNVIIERHSPLEKNKILCFFQNLIYNKNNLKLMVVISKSLKDIISLNSDINHKIKVFPDGAKLMIKKPSYTINIEGKCKFNVGYFGHLYNGRGVEIIISLAKLNKNIFFHLIGGTPEDVSHWKSQTTKLKNIFFYGYINHSLLDSYSSKMDVMLAPYQNKVSVSGGGNTVKWMSPLKIFEYMSYEIPFICSDIIVLKEVLKNNYNCKLVKPNDVKEWDIALHDLLINKDDISKKISLNAYHDLKYKYNWNIRSKNILNSIK